MWKVGDEVRFIKEGMRDSTSACGFVIGNIYKIVQVQEVAEGYRFSPFDDDGYRYWVYNAVQRSVWYIEQDCFCLTRREPKTEVDFLDSFKENFKHGY